MTPCPRIVRCWCRVSAVPGVQLLLVSALRLSQLHITDNQPQLGRGGSWAAELQTGHLNIRDIWYWACKGGTVWWDQIGMSFAGLLGVRKCDARPIWWKHFVSNQNVMEATLRWCYHQSWAVNIKFPNKSFILAASSRAGNEPSRSFTVPREGPYTPAPWLLKLPTVLAQLSIF